MKTRYVYCIFLMILIACDSFKNDESISWIKFEWVGATIEGKYYDKNAINLPFTIEGVPHKLKG